MPLAQPNITLAPLAALVEALALLPGIGPKTAERLALHIVKQPNALAHTLAEALVEAKAKVHPCPQCFTLTDQPLCTVCQHPQRQPHQVCVVVDTADVAALERTQAYMGHYHVLGGVLSPLEGVGVDQLNLRALFERLATLSHAEPHTTAGEANPTKVEVILALPPTTEGDTTSLYISHYLSRQAWPLTLSRIAYGLPVGGHLDYADNLTLTRAMQGRTLL
jgi:recombination protein RecR